MEQATTMTDLALLWNVGDLIAESNDNRHRKDVIAEVYDLADKYKPLIIVLLEVSKKNTTAFLEDPRGFRNWLGNCENHFRPPNGYSLWTVTRSYICNSGKNTSNMAFCCRKGIEVRPAGNSECFIDLTFSLNGRQITVCPMHLRYPSEGELLDLGPIGVAYGRGFEGRIVIGDFNVEPDDWKLLNLYPFMKTDVAPAVRICGERRDAFSRGVFPKDYPTHRDGRRIDWVISPHAKSVHLPTILQNRERVLFDHRPILAECDF